MNHVPRLIWAAVRSAPWATLWLVVGAVGGGIVAAVELLIGKQIVDSLAAAAGFSTVVVWLGWLGAAMLLQLGLDLLGNLAEVDVQERVGIHLQREVIIKAHSVDLVHFEHPTFYDALQRANQDMGPRLVQLMRALVEVLASMTGMTAILAILWQAHWSLAPIMAVGVIPGFWVMLAMRKKSYWVYRMRTPENRLANYFTNLLTRRDEAKEVRLFTLSRHLLHRWLTLAKHLAVERRQIETKQAGLGALTDIVSLAAYSGCLVIIAVLIAGAQVTVGTFSMMMQALQQFGNRIEQVMRNFTTLHEQSLYLADLYEFLEIDAPARDKKTLGAPGTAGAMGQKSPVATGGAGGAGQKPSVQIGGNVVAEGSASSEVAQGAFGELPKAARLELVNVSFTYPGGERPVLRNVNLTIEPGERIALIGENGAGKSTLVRLMMGLYEPSHGQILLNGKDLRELHPDFVRRHFAAVFQEFVRYWFPVRENIRFGRLVDATEDDVRRAAEMSGAAEFIERFSEGYDTLLGRPLGGVDLSGGEWQKLAIARALVREAPIVVLDEPTAALDPKAEAEIYRQFGEMTRGRTAILISHRLGSARLADRIIVLRDGEVIESGTHEALLDLDGEYAGFFTLQAQWYV